MKNLHTDDSIVLYAQWEATTYIVAYHGNGGKLSSDSTKDKTTSNGTIGQALKLKNAETFVREHYDFVGWATDPDATEAEYKGSQILTDGYPGAEAGKPYARRRASELDHECRRDSGRKSSGCSQQCTE